MASITFAPYLQEAHEQALNNIGGVTLTKSSFQAINEAFNNSPFDEGLTVSVKEGFIAGLTITDYHHLFDVYEDRIFDLDINSLWQSIYDQTTGGTAFSEAMDVTGVTLQDEIDTRIMPKFLAGMRDINAVYSTAFVVGKALIAESKVKAMNDAIVKYKLHEFDVTQERWAKTLAWNTTVVTMYSDLVKMYYAALFDEQSRTMEYAVKDRLWNLSLFEYARAMMGALNGAAAAQPKDEPSQLAKSIAGLASGAAAGALLGASNPQEIGTGFGGAIGGILGFAGSFI